MSTTKNINNLMDGLVDDAIDSGLGGQFLRDHVMHEATNYYGISEHIVKPYIKNIEKKREELFYD